MFHKFDALILFLPEFDMTIYTRGDYKVGPKRTNSSVSRPDQTTRPS